MLQYQNIEPLSVAGYWCCINKLLCYMLVTMVLWWRHIKK